MPNLTPFIFEGAEVRIVHGDAGPQFVLADVCRVLEIANAPHAASRLDDDEKRTIAINDGTSGNPNVTVINESGLYSLILTSRKAAAKRFKKWVTSEVLPAIRRTGSYVAPQTREQIMASALLLADETMKEQAAQIAVLAPKAEALDRIAGADGSLSITEAAKALQVRPKDLFGFLSCNGWTYRRAGGGTWLGYQVRTNAGDLTHKVSTLLQADGAERVVEQVKITPQGLAKLAKAMPGVLSAVQ